MPAQSPPSQIAIIHDWLDTFGGAESVLMQILHCFPEADLFSLVDFMPREKRKFIENTHIKTSFLQKFPGSRKHFRNYLPFMPFAIEQFDLSGYDLIISNSHAVAKGVIARPDQLHISYIHSPMRYTTEMKFQYLREANLDRGVRGWVAKWMLYRLRQWDIASTNGVDSILTNSRFVQRRIQKTYRRDAEVIYPPVDTENFNLQKQKADYYVTVSRMTPYKRVDLIAEAFSKMTSKELLIIGDGPQREKVESIASSNVHVLGHLPFEQVRAHLKSARAFVFAAEEDFGIAPVEAQACGTPVIAFGRGGLRETVIENKTGVFFQNQTPDDLIDAVHRFEEIESTMNPQDISKHADQFSTTRFREELTQYVEQAWQDWLALCTSVNLAKKSPRN